MIQTVLRWNGPAPLTVAKLRKTQACLKFWGVLTPALRRCFELALTEFPREPLCVQDNARMVIRQDHMELVFVAGQGECEIFVSGGRMGPGYEVREPTVEVYRERLRSRPQRLNAGILAGIRDRLQSWGVMTKELRSCFALALEKFPKEPACVRDNPGMSVVWDETGLRLISIDGDCEVSVTSHYGEPHYEVTVKSWATYRERLRLSAEPLSIDRLEAVRSDARRLAGTPETVKEALNLAVREFSAEPGCLRKNAQLVIECDVGELVFKSGNGENKVDVCLINGQISYRVGTTTWWVSLLKGCKKLFLKLVEAGLKSLELLPKLLLAVI